MRAFTRGPPPRRFGSLDTPTRSSMALKWTCCSGVNRPCLYGSRNLESYMTRDREGEIRRYGPDRAGRSSKTVLGIL
jgi:hypothetical protein